MNGVSIPQMRIILISVCCGVFLFFEGTLAFDAACIQAQRVVLNVKPLGFGNFFLPRFDLGVKKLLDPATVHADDMVMVVAFVELEDRFAVFKVAAAQDARLFKLRQHTVDRGQPNGDVICEQDFVNVFSAHVPLQGRLKQRQNGLAWPCHFETRVFEVVRFFVHGETKIQVDGEAIPGS